MDQNNLWFFLIGFIPVVLLVFIFISYSLGAGKGFGSKKYVRTDGYILSVRLYDKPARGRKNRKRGITECWCEIEYEFMSNDEKAIYHERVVGSKDFYDSSARGKDLEQGTKVTVLYNPKKPDDNTVIL